MSVSEDCNIVCIYIYIKPYHLIMFICTMIHLGIYIQCASMHLISLYHFILFLNYANSIFYLQVTNEIQNNQGQQNIHDLSE